MTIEQEDAIVHSFILGQFLQNAAFRCIIHGGISKKFHLGKLGHLEFWEQYVESVEHARPTLIMSVFFGFASRPTRFNSVIQLCTSMRIDSGEPPIVASSRYQTFSPDSTPLAI